MNIRNNRVEATIIVHSDLDLKLLSCSFLLINRKAVGIANTTFLKKVCQFVR